MAAGPSAEAIWKERDREIKYRKERESRSKKVESEEKNFFDLFFFLLLFVFSVFFFSPLLSHCGGSKREE